MAKEIISDFLLKLGFDGKEVNAGLDALEKKIKKINSNLNTVTRNSSAQAKVTSTANTREINALKVKNALEAKRLALKRKIVLADKLGGIGTVGFKNSLRGGNPDRIRERTLELDNEILKRRKELGRAGEREAETLRKVQEYETRRDQVLKAREAQTRRRRATALRRERLSFRLEGAESRIRSLPANQRGAAEAGLSSARASISGARSAEGFERARQAVSRFTTSLRNSEREVNRMSRSLNGLAFAQNGIVSSTRNMARGFVSMYAIIAGGTVITRVGMDFETMRASMLAASGSSAQAAKDLEFVEKQAFRLGINLRVASKGFQQMAVSARGVLDDETTRKLFTATLEASTALGLSADDTSGSMRAMNQMLSKGTVSSEELRQQLGETFAQVKFI